MRTTVRLCGLSISALSALTFCSASHAAATDLDRDRDLEVAHCAANKEAPRCAEVVQKLMPKYDAEATAIAFTAAGWTCAAYDLNNGLTCRGKVPGYSDEIAVIVPRRFVPKPNADFILHIHGNQWGGTNDDLLKRFDFPTQLEKSHRKAIMIVPLSSATVTKLNHVEMRDPAKLQLMMDSLMALIHNAGLSEKPVPGHLAVTVHSGGYRTTAAMLRMTCLPAKTCYVSRITELHLIEASYGEGETFTAFALKKGNRFTTTYIPNSETEEVSLDILKAIREQQNDEHKPTLKILTSSPSNLKKDPENFQRYDDHDLQATNPAVIQSDVDHNAAVDKYMRGVLYDSR